MLFGVLKAHPETLWTALSVATFGNTIGGMISFGMSWLLPMTQQLKHVEHVRRHGAPALLLAWTPLLGDALCMAAGWLRLNPWKAAVYMAIGKFARYWVIANAIV